MSKKILLADTKKLDSNKSNPTFFLFKGKEDLATDETKRHKLSLMLFCSLLLILCQYPQGEIKSILGIISFSGDDSPRVDDFIVYGILAICYQAFLYAYHIREAFKVNGNRKNAIELKETQIKFNETTVEIDKTINDINTIYGCLNDKAGSLGDEFEYFASKTEEFYQKYQSVDAAKMQDALAIAESIFHPPDFNFAPHDPASITREKLLEAYNQLKECQEPLSWFSSLDLPSSMIENVKQKIQRERQEQLDYVLAEKKKLEGIVNDKLSILESQRQNFINEMKKLSRSSWLEKIIYIIIPCVYTLLTLYVAMTLKLSQTPFNTLWSKLSVC